MNEKVKLWLRPQLFEFGVLRTPPNSRLSINNILKIVKYLRDKNESYPQMSYSTWRYMACKKLLLEEDCAWMFFRLYQLFGAKSLKRVQREDQLFKNRNESGDSITINGLKFAMFLYIQNIALRRSKWKSEENLNSDSGKTKRNLSEGCQLRFFMSEMDNLLFIISAENVLDRGSIEALSFLIEGSPANTQEINSLVMLLENSNALALEAGKDAAQCFEKKSFRIFLEKYLIKCPFGWGNCFFSGQSSPLSQAYIPAGEKCIKKFPRILENSNLLPCNDKCHGVILFSYLSDLTIAEDTSSMDHSNIKVMKCKNCFFYFLGPLKSLLIESCRNCTFIVGPVELIVSLWKCSSTRLSGLPRQLILSHCHQTHLFLATPQRPLLMNNSQTTLAPLNVYYDKLPQQTKQVHLMLDFNVWNSPLIYDPSNRLPCQGYTILPPAEFYQHKLPFLNYNTINLPRELIPDEYHNEITRRKNQNEQFRIRMRDFNLNEAHNERFHQLMSSEFDEWLTFSYNERQVSQLKNLSTNK